MEDVALGMVSAGLPEAYHISKAIYERDTDALAYHLKVAGTVHGTWYTAYRLNVLWDLYRHGGKNIMSFHKVMQGVNALRGMTLSSVVTPAVGGAVVGGTIHAIETGDTTYTLAHQVMMPIFNWWLGDIGRNDTRGGSEYGLFYNP